MKAGFGLRVVICQALTGGAAESRFRLCRWEPLPMPRSRTIDAAKYRGNSKAMAEYLNVALASGDVALITKAMGDMVRAQGTSRFSRKVGLSREGLYRSFGGQMGPGFDTVMKVLLALDIRLVAKPGLKAKGK
jgi:probable addiction module antidote protein